MACRPLVDFTVSHYRLHRLEVSLPILLIFLPLSFVFCAISIYDIVVFSSCRRVSAILLVVNVITTVASVAVKHGSILTAGIVGTYAAQLIWSALQEGNCSSAGVTASSADSFHHDHVSATVASLLVCFKELQRVYCRVCPAASIITIYIYCTGNDVSRVFVYGRINSPVCFFF